MRLVIKPFPLPFPPQTIWVVYCLYLPLFPLGTTPANLRRPWDNWNVFLAPIVAQHWLRPSGTKSAQRSAVSSPIAADYLPALHCCSDGLPREIERNNFPSLRAEARPIERPQERWRFSPRLVRWRLTIRYEVAFFFISCAGWERAIKGRAVVFDLGKSRVDWDAPWCCFLVGNFVAYSVFVNVDLIQV